MVTILYYEDRASIEEMKAIADQLADITEGKVIVLPKNYDVLFDCSLSQLISVKAIIDAAIGTKLQMVDPSLIKVEVDGKDEQSKIINIEDYIIDSEDDDIPKKGEIIKMSDYLS